MGFFRDIKQKWNRWYYGDLEEEGEDWEEADESAEGYFDDADTRTVYVLECLGQMAEAAEKTETYQSEYDAVTSLLEDMDEIDDLTYERKQVITNLANRIERLERERYQVFRNTGKLEEGKVTLLSRYEDDVPGAVVKMREAEEYRKLIKRDLRKLDGERDSYRYQMREAQVVIGNSRGIAVICAAAMLMSLLLLAVLQFGYEMNVTLGYLVICAAGAIALTVLYVRYQDSVRSLERLEKQRNQLIGLHNTVKIRYINNTNLLQYMYMKYGVDAADELEEDWEIYSEEVRSRQKDEELKAELEYYYDKLTEALKASNIMDPEIWTRQAKALVDPREMVEVRHALLSRRQKLRERLEYNKDVAQAAQKKIKDLARSHPEYSQEIAGIVERYDGV